MAETYSRSGRGGAGNFWSKQDIEEAKKASEPADIEAQKDNNAEPLAHTLTSSQPPPEYLHTGRGGAGNWVMPSALGSSGLVQISDPSTTSPPSSLTSTSNPTTTKPAVAVRLGRGGAGNYHDFADEERQKKKEEERVRKEVEERISRDVEAGLARPGRVYDAGKVGKKGGSWEMGDMS